ncbi:helix-turn-helix transcriptional regulator [Streptomyces sp. NRRL F-5053]|uniref:helix-turn-helix transcriptional regulator n=1 Tax=Streptomyces sp. NRRL F-5053 TaxID=1463854 RepID=UPI00068ABB6C|nr:response regulator transcription factor [Streptomyces sp. NRRL F-5053]
MERIALAISTPSLHRRVGDALAEPGWEIVACDGPTEVPARQAHVVVAESEVLTTRPVLPDTVPLIVLVCGSDDTFWRSPLSRRAAGVVDRDDPDRGFVSAVHQVLRGRGWISPELVPHVLAGMTPQSAPSGRFEQLTDREHDVAALVAAGMSNSEIAKKLTIERSTVKFHVSNVLRKLECRDRAQLAVLLNSGRPTPRLRAV